MSQDRSYTFGMRLLTAGCAGVLLFLSLIFLFGCSKKTEPAPSPTTISNDTADSSVMRIVSMAPNLTEILFALGLDNEIVGVTQYSTYPAAAKEKTCVGSFWQPDVEAVIALKPTLMINLWFEQQASLVSRMQRMGCRTLTLRIETVEELYQAIEQIGQTVDRSSLAQAMIDRLKNAQTELAARYEGREKPKVLWVIQREPFRVAGRETFINELIEIAGGVNAIGPTLSQYPPVSREEVIGCMPDVIIEPAMDTASLEEQTQSAAEFYPRYAAVPAVRNGRVYIVDGDLVSRLGPRLDEAARQVADCLWQESDR